MDCQGLALEWEGSKLLRDQVREKKRLILYPANKNLCEPNRTNAIANSLMLMPILSRLSSTPKWQLPHLDPLQMEISIFANKTGMGIGEKCIYQASVELKKLAGFVKRRVNRKEVTKAGPHHKDLSYKPVFKFC